MRRKSFKDVHVGAIDSVAKRLYKEGNPIKELLGVEGDDLRKTGYYKAWKEKMKDEWSEERIYEFVKKKVDSMSDIVKNGMKDPVLVQYDGKIIDGGHRYALLKGMGHESIITRTI